jgi:hypothetical protein
MRSCRFIGGIQSRRSIHINNRPIVGSHHWVPFSLGATLISRSCRWIVLRAVVLSSGHRCILFLGAIIDIRTLWGLLNRFLSLSSWDNSWGRNCYWVCNGWYGILGPINAEVKLLKDTVRLGKLKMLISFPRCLTVIEYNLIKDQLAQDLSI